MKNYEITVVTPFHDVRPEMFAKCCDSMLTQTIGFQNVEWIVVIHNSAEEYRSVVYELLDGFENVKLHVLDNDKRTPSSPRNFGIERASSRYIAFLDADDSFTPECLDRVLCYMKKNRADITWFRREYELETEDTLPITEVVLWDQTREEIIITPDNRDDEKMFSGICGMVTSRIYDKRFLDRHGIRFDESVPFAEDYLFNIECYGHAERICYLPQLIGYHYYINGSSMVQNSHKDAATLIAYAEGYRKVFDAGLRYGFYMNAIISGLCCVLARFIIASDALTMDDRLQIRDILAPYLNRMTPLRVSKLYSEKAVMERYAFPRAVILDPEDYNGALNNDTLIAVDVRTEQTLSLYQRLLRDILHVNQHTDMGRRYGFNDILTLSGYQKRVPVSDYDTYEPLFRLQTNIGESGIITADPIESYMITLGSMDNLMLIPCTQRQLSPMRKKLLDFLKGKRTFLMLETVPRRHRFNDNAYINTVYGELLANLLNSSEMTAREKRRMFTAPSELLFPEETADYTYLRLLFALSDRRVEQIIAPNTWEVWETFRFLEKNWRRLCDDIESGTLVHFNRVISDEFRAVIEDQLSPDPARAAELRVIFEGGFESPVVPKIWKKLNSVIALGKGSFSIYSESIRRFCGAIPHYDGSLFSSTAVVGVQTDGDGCFRMSSVNAFIEFTPTDDSARAVLAHNVEPGRDYGMLISTYSGLFRYRIRDVVRVERMDEGVPVFTYRYHVDSVIRLSGVTLNNGIIGSAIIALARGTGVPVTDYAYMASEDGRGLVVLAEIRGDAFEEWDTALLSERLEELLREGSDSYREAAESGAAAPVRLCFMEQETQLFYRDIVMNRVDRPTDLLRPVRYINTPAKERFFLSRVIK